MAGCTAVAATSSPAGKTIAVGCGDGKVLLWGTEGAYISKTIRKDEFETTDEYLQRVKGLRVPYVAKVQRGRYDADKGLFRIEIEGMGFLVAVDRDKAKEISSNRDEVFVSGQLVYAFDGVVELVGARLVTDPLVHGGHPVRPSQ
ncbi:MAG: hypothetical protein QHH07_01930 [Sedimentisphaerales bacterium]|nr:hypothetical protein [Sedimentisphaerales bacterium]